MKHITADLHLHSTHSDGELSPTALVEAAAQVKLTTLSLTDHDSIAGIEEMKHAGKRFGLDVIAGVEMSAYLQDTELHILGFFIDTSPGSALAQLLAGIRAERPARLLKMAEKLRSLGVKLTDKEVTKEVGSSESPGRAHIAAALVKNGSVANMNEAFVRYIGVGGPGYILKKKYTPDEITQAIHDAGGVAILAHPAQYRGIDLVQTVLKFNLDGIEIFHHSHSPGERERLLAMAQSRSWRVSGGSDYHGPNRKPGIEVGSNGLGARELKALRENR